MKINIVACSSPAPIGGVTTLYHFANALADRGNEVHLYHVPIWSLRIESLDDLDWFRFHPAVQHHHDPDEVLGPADVIFGTGAGPEAGLPVHLVQGREILYAELERSAYQTPSLKIAVATWLRDAGEHWGFPAERCRVVLQGIDHDDFRVTTPIEEREVRVAMLHNSHPAKGWPVGYDALLIAKEQVPELRASVFGTSTPEEDLPDWIEFTANPDRDVLVEQILNRSRLFVQSSDYEGFGLTAVEAMACGCALISTDNGGSRDYAFHHETALVVPPGDRAQLAAAMVQVLTDDDLRVRLAEAGLAHASTFTWAHAGRTMEAELLSYLADPEPHLAEIGPGRGPVRQEFFLDPFGTGMNER